MVVYPVLDRPTYLWRPFQIHRRLTVVPLGSYLTVR
jgi:hypothetical protein